MINLINPINNTKEYKIKAGQTRSNVKILLFELFRLEHSQQSLQGRPEFESQFCQHFSIVPDILPNNPLGI